MTLLLLRPFFSWPCWGSRGTRLPKPKGARGGRFEPRVGKWTSIGIWTRPRGGRLPPEEATLRSVQELKINWNTTILCVAPLVPASYDACTQFASL